MIEAELKIPLPENAAEAGVRLPQDARCVKDVEQVDIYLQHPGRDFGVSDEALRIRQEGTVFWLAYKGPKQGGRVKVREELEVSISCAETALGILERLGFLPAARVCKRRRVYRWGKILICVDDVSELGRFVELEIAESSARDDPDQVLADSARRLGLDPETAVTESYLELLLHKRAAHHGKFDKTSSR